MCRDRIHTHTHYWMLRTVYTHTLITGCSGQNTHTHSTPGRSWQNTITHIQRLDAQDRTHTLNDSTLRTEHTNTHTHTQRLDALDRWHRCSGRFRCDHLEVRNDECWFINQKMMNADSSSRNVWMMILQSRNMWMLIYHLEIMNADSSISKLWM